MVFKRYDKWTSQLDLRPHLCEVTLLPHTNAKKSDMCEVTLLPHTNAKKSDMCEVTLLPHTNAKKSDVKKGTFGKINQNYVILCFIVYFL